MIVFPENHVDLTGNITYTAQQLRKRWAQELARKWSMEVQTLLRDFIEIKDLVDPETFPGYASNVALLSAFIADQTVIHSRREADYVRNQLLIDTLAYEAAVQRKAELELLIDGREAVDEVLDEFDEIITPAVEAIEALQVDSDAHIQAVADLAEADAVIAGASAEVLALASQRNF
jgi:hypothetical protein